MAARWEVVGGVGRGGILVREGPDFTSPQLPERLSTSAIVQQLGREGDRLHYELLQGTGPQRGWVSVDLNGKVLLREAPILSPEEMLEVRVLTMGAGLVAELKLPGAATAGEVQEALCKVLGAPEGEQHLLVGTQELRKGSRLCDVATQSPVEVTLLQTKAVGLAAASGGHDGSVHLFDLEQGKLLKSCSSSAGAVTCLSLNLASKQALSGHAQGGLLLWDMGSAELQSRLGTHEGGVSCLQVDWQRGWALSGGQDAKLRLWDLEYGEGLLEFEGHNGPVTALDWDTSLDCAVSGSRDCSLRLWNVQTGSCFKELQGHMAPVNCVTASFPRQMAISGSIAIVRVWFNIAIRGTHECYRDHEGHVGWVVFVAADWRREVTLSLDQDGTMRLFGPDGTSVVRSSEPQKRMTSILPLWSSGRFLRAFDDGSVQSVGADGAVVQEMLGGEAGALCLACDGAADASAPAGVALVLLSMSVDSRQQNVFEIQFPASVLGSCKRRPSVGQLRQQLREHHPLPYLEKLRFQRSGRKKPLGDEERVPVPPEELEVGGPGSVVQALMLAMQGASGEPQAAEDETQ